jgi:hypothetical protein
MAAMPAPSPGAGATPTDSAGAEARREAYTTALYVAICLLAVLIALADRPDRAHLSAFKLIWGTTIGLALAHWFAFRVSARLVGAGTFGRRDAEAAAAQLVGALAVAVLATVPVVVLPAGSELDVVRLLLAGFIAAWGSRSPAAAAPASDAPPGTRARCWCSRSRSRSRRTCWAVTEAGGPNRANGPTAPRDPAPRAGDR